MNALDLMLDRLALLAVHFRGRGSGQTPLRPVHDRRHHLQIADQFGASSGRGVLPDLPLCFEEQLGRVQNAFAHAWRTLAPSRVQLAGFPRVGVMPGQDGGHPLAVLQVLPGHRHQILQGHLRRHLSFAHLLLD